MPEKQISIVITSAVAIGGEIKKADTEIAVDEAVAKDLLQRGKAELAVADPEKTSPAGKTAPKATKK